jgi:hypothetical protein
MTEFITQLKKFISPLWGYHFPIPDQIANMYIDGNNRRVIAQINGVIAMKAQNAMCPDARKRRIFYSDQQKPGGQTENQS